MDQRRRFCAAIARTGLVVLVAGGCAMNTVNPIPAERLPSPVADSAASTALVVDADGRPPTETSDQRTVREAAAEAYLGAVEPTNEAYHALGKRYAHETSLEANSAYCRELAEVDHALLSRIRGIAFPAGMAGEVRDFMAQVAVQEARDRSCGQAASAEDWQRIWDDGAGANLRAHELAYLIRAELGLLPDPG